MAEVSMSPNEPDTGEGVFEGALPRPSTISALAADPDNNANFTPGPLESSQTTPVQGTPEATSGSQQGGGRSPRGPQGNNNGRGSISSQTALNANAESSAVDPLSRHILKRTNTEHSIPAKLLGRASYEAEAGGGGRHSQTELGPIRGDGVPHPRPRDKKKGISFLSRIIPGRKKDQLPDAEDDASEPDTSRMDDYSSSQPIGFIPRFPRPPKYLRVKAHYKREKTFNKVFIAQELEDTDGPPNPSDKPSSVSSTTGQHDKRDGKAVWAMVFSNDGRYLAAAGQDTKVRVWAVISSTDDRNTVELEGHDAQDDGEPRQLKAPVFRAKPVQVYEGHKGSILDLSWSKNNFLLSSSMDKTVRLWHVTRPECLCCFKHSDFVTSIQFHPRDDRFFLAGSLDTKLRLWSIPDKTLAFVTTAPDLVTSVAFTPDGQHSIAGCLNGVCSIYETDGLKAMAQIHVRSARGRNAKGSKITGIDTMVMPPNNPHGETKLLITSNDSRIRMYNFRDRTLVAKFRGNENTCSQIRAVFSDDGNHVICGSEDRRTYIWPVSQLERDSDKRAVEIFDTHSPMVTVAVMAPVKAKQILGFSEDPIYDICNPLPVALGGQSNPSPPDTPRQGVTNDEGGRNRNSVAIKLAHESPTYLARSTHPDGNIIVVADYSGKIKVLRQDCAYQKRRYDSWDNSAAISKKLLSRSNSARRSVASSIGRESWHKTPSERIISWRNSVIGHELGLKGSRASAGPSAPSSPGFSFDAQTESRPSIVLSQPPSAYKSSMESGRSSGEAARPNTGSPESTRHPGHSAAAAPVASGTDKEKPLGLHGDGLRGDHSYAFWNKITRDALAANSRKPGHLLSPTRTRSGERKFSMGSALSSDYPSSNGEGDDGEILKCDNCRGTNFRGTKGRDGKQRLICVGCGRPVS